MVSVPVSPSSDEPELGNGASLNAEASGPQDPSIKVPALKVGASEKQPLTGEVATTTLAGSAQKESQVAWHAEYTPWTCAESILQVTAAGAFDNAQRSIDVNSIEQDSSPHDWLKLAEPALTAKGAASYSLTLRADGALSLSTYEAVGSAEFLQQLRSLVASLNNSEWSRTIAHRLCGYFPADSFTFSGGVGRGMIVQRNPRYPDLLVQ